MSMWKCKEKLNQKLNHASAFSFTASLLFCLHSPLCAAEHLEKSDTLEVNRPTAVHQLLLPSPSPSLSSSLVSSWSRQPVSASVVLSPPLDLLLLCWLINRWPSVMDVLMLLPVRNLCVLTIHRRHRLDGGFSLLLIFLTSVKSVVCHVWIFIWTWLEETAKVNESVLPVSTLTCCTQSICALRNHHLSVMISVPFVCLSAGLLKYCTRLVSLKLWRKGRTH